MMQVMIVRKFEKTRGREVIKHRAYQAQGTKHTVNHITTD